MDERVRQEAITAGGKVVFAYEELADPIALMRETLFYRVFYTSPRLKGEWQFICYCAEEETAAHIAGMLAATLPESTYGGNVDAATN